MLAIIVMVTPMDVQLTNDHKDRLVLLVHYYRQCIKGFFF